VKTKAVKLLPCPFCGKVPDGKRFCSTDFGPALTCNHCLVDGPPALDKQFVGASDVKLRPLAIKAWNRRSLDDASYRRGIEAAASLVEQFDRYVLHPWRLSDCILAKFNMIGKRKIRKNEDRRTPARRKVERRVPGGPLFVLGSALSRERRERRRREAARRRLT
jgi:hypothetical protein